MQDKRILIAGCGKIGMRLAKVLAEQFQVWGLSRSVSSNEQHIQFIQADLRDKDALRLAFETMPNTQFDYVVYCLTPADRTEQAYRDIYIQGVENLLNTLPLANKLRRFYFVSSTSVYHQDDFSVVNEDSPTQPDSFSGKVLLEAERSLSRFNIRTSVVRFSGIYGGHRSHLIESIKMDKSPLSSSARFSNRIHEDDCVGFLAHLIQQQAEGTENKERYLATDSCPVDLNEVIQWIADKINTSVIVKSESNFKRRSGNKRCSNIRMLGSGYQLKFPSYREGYAEMMLKLT